MNQQAIPINHMTHNGELSLKFENRRNKTILSRCYQTPPLKASRPMYLNAANPSEATVYLMETSGGLVAGDNNDFQIDIVEGADVCLIPQSATKIYPSENELWSTQNIGVSIDANASLTWKTEALIPFDQAKFNGKTVIRMKEDSTLLWGEILSPGRTKSGETFQYSDVKMNFQVWMDDECLIYDPFLFSPEKTDLSGLGMLENHLYVGSLWFITPTLKDFDIRKLNEELKQIEDVKVSASMLEGKAINVRWLASDTVLLQKEMNNIWQKFTDYIYAK